MKWRKRFLALAEHVSTWSRDPSTKVGAVIVNDDRQVLSLGFNGFPRGVADKEERYNDRPIKYKLIVHAEANAILNATGPIHRYTLYTTKFPCSECTKLIIQAGISEIVIPYESPNDESVLRWADDRSFSKIMLEEASVRLLEI